MAKKQKKQSQPLRIEHPDMGSFGTVRTIESRLWFVNSPDVEYEILARLAQYTKKFGVKLYSFVFSGSHFHPLAKFPNCNRAGFYRDLDARAAEIVKSHHEGVPEGPLFARRYSEQAVPENEDMEEQFFYCALQPVQAGLCKRISDYPGYNSFSDAINGVKRKYKIVDWGRYNGAKRYNKKIRIEDYTTEHTLEYERLPGYEHLSQKEYRDQMLRKLELRQAALVKSQMAKNPNHYYQSKEELKKVVPGTPAKNPKRSKREDKRPLVLTKSLPTKTTYLDYFFSTWVEHKECVQKYKAGDLTVEFPPGTYRPPGVLGAVPRKALQKP
jgi:hypothetical protein